MLPFTDLSPSPNVHAFFFPLFFSSLSPDLPSSFHLLFFPCHSPSPPPSSFSSLPPSPCAALRRDRLRPSAATIRSHLQVSSFFFFNHLLSFSLISGFLFSIFFFQIC
ncbi:hypothetical protein JHK82_022510 [Glycine max]|nr:hypothetical protein JHK85_023000 [Glycine max]KAG5026609.1 hypothetical protein JHK86_022523 [Glycine max]KAG5137779.1 hypothetical protein JHK82_022510 [Glycine max]